MNSALLKLQIGPVQDFIAQARSTRDLWSGSYLLSWLVTAGLCKLVERMAKPGQAPKDAAKAVIFPSLEDQPLFHLQWNRGNRGGHSPQACLTPTVPNLFVASLVVDVSSATQIASDVEKAIRDEWERIAESCWEKLSGDYLVAPEQEARFDHQISNFLSVSWQCTPWDANYAAGYKENGWQLDAVRQTRVFHGWSTGQWRRDGDANKDSLTGREEAICGGNEWWQQNIGKLRESNPKGYSYWSTVFRERQSGDRYGAVTLVKRLWHRVYLAKEENGGFHGKLQVAKHLPIPSTYQAANHDPDKDVDDGRFCSIELVNESRLLLHLGRASVLENVGLYAERTTGLPTIPGTAIKGVLSTWAYWEGYFGVTAAVGEINMPSKLGGRPDEKETLTRHWIENHGSDKSNFARRIFGSDNSDGSEHAGRIAFVGGFPTEAPKLGLDIVNPHHEASGLPKLRLAPNVFLCIEPGMTWCVAFYARPSLPQAEANDLLQTTERWLREAFAHCGIGAKTAASYGRFRDSKSPNAVAPIASPSVAAEIARKRLPRLAEAAATPADYPNDPTFKNRVIGCLDAGKLAQLEKEVPILQKPENSARLNQLKTLLSTKDYKDIRRRLRERAWFPKEWLPQP